METRFSSDGYHFYTLVEDDSELCWRRLFSFTINNGLELLFRPNCRRKTRESETHGLVQNCPSGCNANTLPSLAEATPTTLTE